MPPTRSRDTLIVLALVAAILIGCSGCGVLSLGLWWFITPGLPPARAHRVEGRLPAPSLEAPPATVYLADMGPELAQAFTDGSWGFGGHGTIGTVDFQPIKVGGITAVEGLGVQPPSSGASRIVYRLDKNFGRCSGSAAIADSGLPQRTPLTFRINGDGRELWRSRIFGPGIPMLFDIDVATIVRLEFIVDCPGSNHGAHAVWVDPKLTRLK